jgi:hypothetical protein
MRSPIIHTLLVASSVVAAVQQEQRQPGWENVLSARQAFREIHDHLLGVQLQLSSGKVPQWDLEGYGAPPGMRENATGWTEVASKEDDLSTGTRKGNVKEDPEDRPRGKSKLVQSSLYSFFNPQPIRAYVHANIHSLSRFLSLSSH